MIDVPVRVKDALRDGRLKKNYRFVVLNDDGSADFTIDNNTLVSESVKFDERMCSGDTLKFGLCEGSSLEFQYFDHPNINGRRIQSFIDVEYVETFKYFDAGAELYDVTKSGSYTFKSSSNAEFGILDGELITYYTLTSSNNYRVTLDLQRGQEMMIESGSIMVTSPAGFLQTYTIPMGYFTAEKCPRQASTGIFKVTAYNKLQAKYLDQKANDMIKEIVSQGMSGSSTGVDIAVILDKLLGDYAIKRQEETVGYTFRYIEPSSTSNATYTCVNSQGQSRGLYLHYFMATLYITPANYSSDNVYRLLLNCYNLYNAVISYAESTVSEYMDETFKADSSSTIQTLANILSGDGATQINTGIAMTSKNSQRLTVNVGGSIKNEVSYPTDWFVDLTEYNGTAAIVVGFPCFFIVTTSSSITWSSNIKEIAEQRVYDIFEDTENIIVQTSTRSQIEKLRITEAQAESLPDVTLRQLQAAVFEINAQYGQIDRVTDLFQGVELNQSRLLPSDTLYPANNLYPGGKSERGDSSAYSKLWTDNQGAQKFRNLIITYKGLDEEDKAKDMTLQRTINASGNVDYVMSDNWLFKNLIWTAADIGDYADAMVTKMQNVTWFPFEMWCAGLPYLETGDEIEITNDEGTYTSYILQRQLNGVQNLQDTFINGTLDVF